MPDLGVTIQETFLGNGKRFVHVERFLQKPEVNATLACPTPNAAEIAAALAANKNFERQGTNAASGSSAYVNRGIVKMATSNSANDQQVLVAHADSGQSLLNSIQWRPDWRPRIEAVVQALDIAAVKIALGFKLTPTTIDKTTDANQAIWLFDAAADSAWRTHLRVGSADKIDVARSDFALVDDRWYRLILEFEADGNCVFKIGIADGDIHTVARSSLVSAAAMTSAVTGLKPFIAVQTTTTAAKEIGIGGLALGVDLN